MRCSILLVALLAASCYAAVGPKKPAAKANANDNEVLEGLPEACRQPAVNAAATDNKKSKDNKSTGEQACTLRKPYYSDEDQANHFCIVCKQNDTQKKPAVGPGAAGADSEVAKNLAQVVQKQLAKNADFDDNSGLTIIVQGVDKPINISKALDDPNNDNDHVLDNVEEVLYMFKNKTIARVEYKNGEPNGPPEEVDCEDCEKQLKELKPQQRTPEQQQQQAARRREQEARQLQRQQSQPTNEDEGDENANENDDDVASGDANGQMTNNNNNRDYERQQQDARRRQQYDQQQQQQQRQQQPRLAAPPVAYGGPYQSPRSSYQQPQYDTRQQQPQYPAASGSGGASTKSVPAACRQEIHFTTEDGICSLHVPQGPELCITCRADRADAYQVLQSLDSLAQRLAPNNYQYLAANNDIVLVFDPAARDNRVYDFSREFAQHDPLVRKIDEAYYFFPNQSVAVQKFDDYGREDSMEPFRTYDDYLRRYQRAHDEEQQQQQQDQQQPAAPNTDDAASRDYNNDYYRRQQEQYRQQQLAAQQQQPAYGAPSTDAYGRVHPASAQQTRSPYYQQQQPDDTDRRREQWELQQRQRQQQQQQQQVQPTPTYTPTVYATADYYRTQPYPTTTTPYSTTPAYGRTYAYTDRTNQPAYGTMMVSVVTLQPTSTITVTADQHGNIVRPTAYAPYIRPDQRGQRQTMCLVVETTTTAPAATAAVAQPYRSERSPNPVRTVPYAGQPGIYVRNPTRTQV